MAAHRRCCQVNGRAAVGTIHNLDVLSQLVDLLLRERMYEVFLAQEIQKADKSPVLLFATPIGELGLSLESVRKQQVTAAARAAEVLREQRLTGGRMFADELHQLQRGGG